MKTFTVRWQVEDGYAGGARPQSTTVRLDEFEGDESKADIESILSEIVQNDFEQNISWSGDLEEVAAEIHAALSATE